MVYFVTTFSSLIIVGLVVGLIFSYMRRIMRETSDISLARTKIHSSTYLKILIGAPIVYAVGSLFAGAAFLSIVFYSTLCTAGVGGVIWGMLCNWVGSAALALLIPLRGGGVFQKLMPAARIVSTETTVQTHSVVTATPQTFTREQIAISNYIRDAYTAGMTDLQIREKLGEVGWTGSDIEAGFSLSHLA